MTHGEENPAAGGKPWDIPVLPLDPRVRCRLHAAALERARSEGFALAVQGGHLLAQADAAESEWLGRPAFRVWSAATEPLLPSDLDALAIRLADVGAAFAVLSAWQRPSRHRAFLDVGASVHALIEGPVPQARAGRADRVEIRTLGDVPEAWISRIVASVATVRWHDRQARDPKLDPEAVALRRQRWLEACLRKGDGVLAVSLDETGAPGQYLLIPFDRSRVPFGGPVIGGLNGLQGRLTRGPWSSRATMLATYPHLRTAVDSLVIQYQEENTLVRRLVDQCFAVCRSTRFDRHWHFGQEWD